MDDARPETLLSATLGWKLRYSGWTRGPSSGALGVLAGVVLALAAGARLVVC